MQLTVNLDDPNLELGLIVGLPARDAAQTKFVFCQGLLSLSVQCSLFAPHLYLQIYKRLNVSSSRCMVTESELMDTLVIVTPTERPNNLKFERQNIWVIVEPTIVLLTLVIHIVFSICRLFFV